MYKTPEQDTTLHTAIPVEGIQFNAEFLQSLQLVLFHLVQRAHHDQIMRKRLLAAPPELQTFMGTPVREIPFYRLLFIDGHHEDAEEIVNLMKMNADSGKKLFLNPRSVENNLFSTEAIQTITQNFICRSFILEHEIEQNRLSQIELPDQFYKALQTYLMELYAIGDSNSDSWGFVTSDGQEDHGKLVACLNARNVFFETVKNVCDADQQKALAQKVVSISLRRGSTAEVKFDTVGKGKYPYECIITQQIYLWAMLRAKKQDVIVPKKLRFHGQARHYDLGALLSRFEWGVFHNTFDHPVFRPSDTLHNHVWSSSSVQERFRNRKNSADFQAQLRASLAEVYPLEQPSNFLEESFIQERIQHANQLESRGEREDALATFLIVLRLNPENREAQEAVIRLRTTNIYHH